ncbi:MAG: putative glycolipid-binding domain-containing protein [Candidatus Latescibacterota bacterium]
MPQYQRPMTVASILWRRLNTPGHDACRLVRSAAGWRLEGAAVFRQEGGVAQLAYDVKCDLAWRTQLAHVRGWLGANSREFSIARTNTGIWTARGVAVPDLENCVDLDFGFTPATNLIQFRRLALDVGKAAEAPVAWFDVSAKTLVRLPQRYERRTEKTYWYESPSVGYAAFLEIDAIGFIRKYPGLWDAET